MKKHTILIYLLALTFVTNGFAQLNTSYFDKIKTQKISSEEDVEWVQFGPGMSGYNEMFWCHPTDVNTMFMGPDMHVSYGTWDNGDSWQTIKDSDGNGLDMRRVHDIEFSLQDADFGVAIEREGEVFTTSDRGKTWTSIDDIGGAHADIAIDPTNDNIWFIGAGDFWNVKENHRTEEKPNGIKQDRADYGYVLKTTDKGKSFKKVATNISDDLDVGRIIISPKNPDKIIMATSHGIFRSTDGGENWNASNTGLPNNLPRDLTSYYNSATNEFILYLVEQSVYTADGSTVNSTGGVYKSTDQGSSWTSITGNLGIDLQTITDWTSREYYHKSVAYWFGISKDESKDMYTTYPNNILSVYNRIVVNPSDKNEIYLCHNKKHDKGFGPGDLWKTEDGGNTWFACARNGKYWISGDNQSYWEEKGNSANANVEFAHLQREMDELSEIKGTRHLAINIEGDVFIGIGQQTLRSTDKGASWHQVDDYETEDGSKKWISRGTSDLPGRLMIHETGVEGRTLLCSGEHGLWQTSDLGSYSDKNAVAVEQIEGQVNEDGAHSISTVAVHPNDPDIIYILMWRQDHQGKVRRSTDGGKTWTNIATVFEATGNAPFQYSLMFDPNNPDIMYFCTIRKAVSEVGTSVDESTLTKGAYGVYKSTDAGFNWTLKNSGLPSDCSVRRLAMDPDNSSTLYAALNKRGLNDPGGLYKTTNKAGEWSKVTLPSEILSVNNVFIDKNTKDIFISCGSRQEEYEAGGVWRSKDNGSSWDKIFAAPYVWETETSPANSDYIMVSVPAQVPDMVDDFMNPGLYVSKDDGNSWMKINKGLGQPDKIVEIQPDPIDQNVLYCSAWGSGWYKATIPGGTSVSESVSFNNLPSSISSSENIKVEIKYTVSKSRDLVVVLNSPSGSWLGSGRKTVSSGSGTTTVTINLETAPEADNDYKLRCDLRPEGGSSSETILSSETTIDITDGASSGDLVSFQNQGSLDYISSEDPELMTCEKTSVGSTEKFEIIDNGDGTVSFKGSNGLYVSSEDGTKEMTCKRDDIGNWEKFTMIDYGNDIYALKGNNDLYVRNSMLCNSESAGSWQQFLVTRGLKNATSTSTLSNTNFTVYPNPVAGGLITIELSNNLSDVIINVYASSGKLVYNASTNSKSIQLSADNFESGLYIISVRTQFGIKSQKLMIE
ncbi:VPS10 domain-containing protein [Saccharicrinis aurantiacus]|uniref:VPS10 domain-containing protein n=1 Tax=Saccharicrinis aurantiacus TaxID=1849719 RepID=UPI000837FC16|nr:T9SS type A sorting domain-containing protein [Saccharicrinis aurantiacus]